MVHSKDCTVLLCYVAFFTILNKANMNSVTDAAH